MDLPGAIPDIDAVITWVDGGDPAHRRKMQPFLGDAGRGRPEPGAADATRFGDCGEIAYCVASLLRFAPWLRRIHIVTDAQVPALLAELRGSEFESRVALVDHRDIFAGYEQFLPSFSSLGIEGMLWRIPGLAERFIYLNDDFQLLRPVTPGDFFRGEDVVLRGRWRDGRLRRTGARLRAAWARLSGRAPKSAAASYHAAQQLSAAMVGFDDRFFQVPHCPHPLRKSVLAAYFAEHPDALPANLAHRFRAVEQFLLVALGDHLALRAGNAVIDNSLGTLRLKPSSQGVSAVRRQLAHADADPRIAFSCVQSLDAATAPTRDAVLAWLDRRIGGIPALLRPRAASPPGPAPG